MARRKLASAAATNANQFEHRTGLVSKKFSLELLQKYEVQGIATTRFRLYVIDSKGDRYQLSPAAVSDEVDLICKLLRRIATAKAQPGWTFEADFYPAQQVGTITG